MTREEAIKLIEHISIAFVPTDQYGDYDDPRPYEEALDMAIEALKQPSNATQLLDDGTLKVRVANVLDIKRVMVMDDNVIYDSYYPDRPKGKWKWTHGGQCSECGFHNTNFDFNFCPNCGADMR